MRAFIVVKLALCVDFEWNVLFASVFRRSKLHWVDRNPSRNRMKSRGSKRLHANCVEALVQNHHEVMKSDFVLFGN